MRTSSGWLVMTKTERNAIETVLRHCERDISFGGGGTFTDLTPDDNADTKEIARAEKGIELVRWILDTYGTEKKS